jgi:tetratricopeptide (TPR) repeat protein
MLLGHNSVPNTELDAQLETRRRTLLGCLLLFAFLLYANSLANGFVYDDHSQIEQNPYVHSLKNVGTLFWTSQLAQQGKQEIRNYYRPIVNLEYLLCFSLFGSFPPGFHLVAVLMHCLVVWLVYAVTAELRGKPSRGKSVADDAFAQTAAACFALHPAHTEVADWLGAIADIEMSIFYLCAFWLFLRLGRPEVEHTEARQVFWLKAAMLASFLLATMSKETAITLPAVVTVYEHFCRADRRETIWMAKLRRYGGFWITALLYLAVRGAVLGGFAPTRQHVDIGTFDTVLTAVALIGRYAAKLVWPAPLVAFYPFQKSASLFDPAVLLGIAVILAASAFLVYTWKRNRIYAFALFWMFFTIAPVLNVHLMTAIVFAERYLYLPSVGFCWLAAGAILWCWREPWRSGVSLRSQRWALGLAAGVFALLFAAKTVARNRDWKDDGAVARGTLRVYPETSYLRSDVGMIEWRRGNRDEAMRQWHLALAYKPNTPGALANIGFAMLEEKNYAAAIPPLQQAIALSPQFAFPHVYLGRVYAAQGQNAQAEAEFTRAIEIYPMNSLVRNAAGRFYLDIGRAREAQAEFLISTTIDSNEDAWSGLAESYTLQNVTESAEPAWQEVVARDPIN